MAFEIPFSSDAAQSFTTQLGETKYFFEARFNSRSGVWTMDISDDATRQAIIVGVPIVIGVDLLDPYNFGIGSIFVIDTAGTMKDASADDLGSRVKVFWGAPGEEFA